MQESNLLIHMTKADLKEEVANAVREALKESKESSKSEDKYLTRDEVVKLLRISPSKLRQMMLDKRIPYSRIGRRLVFKLSEIEAMINSNQIGSLIH